MVLYCQSANRAELSELSLLSVGVDGNTDLLINKLKSALIINAVGLSDNDVEGLKWMREEEKLAGDLHTLFNSNYSLRIFANISRSESTHANAVLYLLEQFGIEDPANDEPGVFANENLQAVFDELKLAGEFSLVEALKVGAYVEELDILDLEQRLEDTANEDIELVYENLLRGSCNHLRAFTRVLARSGYEYQPTLLSEEYFEETIEGEMERGGAAGSCALGYDYANRNGNSLRDGYYSADCDSVPATGGTGQQNRYRNGKGGN
ncbi:DUF2202 domain-containing protein [uncultured Sunxiuqinia sp.]|uniref:DUF2202 domain-containing protein n=1 Tax=uncultured Sunxiuqinia sp. TaxID=1573825 RepID=UPI002AA95DAC|nr:DUF2202 domain-containing protein [uncultured Sunxiuqinia sp.]